MNNNREILEDLISLCSEELAEINKNKSRKREMFERFKSYYVLIENYFKYNSPKNKYSSQYSFDDFKSLPTTVSISLYEKYQQELDDRRNQQSGKNDKSFMNVFLEAFKEARINETDTNSAYDLLKRTKTEREQPSTEAKKEGTNR